jgi:protoheme IX farnesyltransferase
MSVTAASLAASPARTADYVELTKPRITLLVLVTAAVGYLLATPRFDAATFVLLCLGTLLVAGAASALNQYFERDTDALMTRTRNRPIPSGRVRPVDALLFGLAASLAGLALLAAVNFLTLVLGVAASASYVLLYTPLKRKTSLCTVVGALPGALPPAMGWAAGANELTAGAFALFAILFVWQLPHFLAIGWMMREDYARAGFPMLTVLDEDGTSTARQMVLYAAALLPITLAGGLLVRSGSVYLWGALALGLAFLAFCFAFLRRRTLVAARAVFLVSILYLPAVLGLLVADR